MGLGFGLLSAQLRPGETDWSRAYDETIHVAKLAEDLGYTSIWTTEHHFVDDGYMPSLAVVSAAIAAATSRIEIATGVLLAPMHDPLRLAEDAATVSLLSDGRFTLGLGLGWSATEFAAFGSDRRKRGKAMDEILTILRKAWSGGVFKHSGNIYDLPELAVRPVPSKPIPMLIGGSAEAAIRRAARLADGIFANVPIDDFLQQLAWITDECDRIGRDPAELRIIHYSIMLPDASEEAALETWTKHLWQMMWKYSDMEPSATRSGPPAAAPPLTEDRRNEMFRRSTIAGSPAQIVERLHEVRDASPLPVEFVARSYFPTLTLDRQTELMQQLIEDIAPHV